MREIDLKDPIFNKMYRVAVILDPIYGKMLQEEKTHFEEVFSWMLEKLNSFEKFPVLVLSHNDEIINFLLEAEDFENKHVITLFVTKMMTRCLELAQWRNSVYERLAEKVYEDTIFDWFEKKLIFLSDDFFINKIVKKNINEMYYAVFPFIKNRDRDLPKIREYILQKGNKALAYYYYFVKYNEERIFILSENLEIFDDREREHFLLDFKRIVPQNPGTREFYDAAIACFKTIKPPSDYYSRRDNCLYKKVFGIF